MKGKRIPADQEEAIVRAYRGGLSAKEAAAQFGYSPKVCLAALKRRSLPRRDAAEAKQISKEHQVGIIEAYQAGASAKEAAAQFGCAQQTCLNILRRHGIAARKTSETSRRYRLDESFFDWINSEAKAYWLGFVTADGGIKPDCIDMKLQARDIGHLKKMADAMQADHPISLKETKRGNKSYPYAHLQISSLRLLQALAQLGVGPNKSFTVQPCLELPEHLLAHYWRGVVDGDGCITCSGRFHSQWTLKLVGNRYMVEGFRRFISLQVHSKAQIKPKYSVFEINYTGNILARRIVEILYDKACVYLDRKMARANEIMNR